MRRLLTTLFLLIFSFVILPFFNPNRINAQGCGPGERCIYDAYLDFPYCIPCSGCNGPGITCNTGGLPCCSGYCETSTTPNTCELGPMTCQGLGVTGCTTAGLPCCSGNCNTATDKCELVNQNCYDSGGVCRDSCEGWEYNDPAYPGCPATAALCCFPQGSLGVHHALCYDTNQIRTPFGCIDYTSSTAVATALLSLSIGIAGGIAFLIIVYAGFLLMTSTGNPERIKHGQDLMTAALAGLVMIIFSVVLLRLIGVNILGLGLN